MKPHADAPNLLPFYLLLVCVGGIVAHLASEFAAMGSDAEHVVFSALHSYLALTAFAGIALFIVRARFLWAQSSGGRDLKRLLNIGLARLPFAGKGKRFYALTAALQLTLGLATQFGEGCPFCGHNIAAGIFGAFATVLLLAIAGKVLARKLPSLVDALVRLLPVPVQALTVAYARAHCAAIYGRQTLWYPQLFSRPPPSLQFATASS